MNKKLVKSVFKAINSFNNDAWKNIENDYISIKKGVNPTDYSMQIRTYQLKDNKIDTQNITANISGKSMYKHFFNLFVVKPKLLGKICTNLIKNKYLSEDQSKKMTIIVNFIKQRIGKIEKIFNNNSKMLKENMRNYILEVTSCKEWFETIKKTLKIKESKKNIMNLFEEQIYPIIDKPTDIYNEKFWQKELIGENGKTTQNCFFYKEFLKANKKNFYLYFKPVSDAIDTNLHKIKPEQKIEKPKSYTHFKSISDVIDTNLYKRKPEQKIDSDYQKFLDCMYNLCKKYDESKQPKFESKYSSNAEKFIDFMHTISKNYNKEEKTDENKTISQNIPSIVITPPENISYTGNKIKNEQDTDFLCVKR